MRMSSDAILARIRPDLEADGLWQPALTDGRRAWIAAVIDLVKPRARKLADVASQLRPFLTDRVERDPAAVATHLSDPAVLAVLPAWRDRLRVVEPFDAPALEAALRALAEERGVKAGALIHATRVVVTGQAVSPGLFDVLHLVGRDRVVARLSE
jgi:glutamyl-tRNA synthetase